MPSLRVRSLAPVAAFAFSACAAFVCSALPAQAAATRIVSLMPSITEDLFAIGAGPQVVGVSSFTDYPAAALKVPVVSTYMSVDAERIASLHPDLVVGIANQAALVGDLKRLGLHVELLRDDSFDDLFACMSRLGDLTGHAAEARTLESSLRAKTARLVATVPKRSTPSAFVVIGLAPIFTVGDGSYIAHLIALAGGRNASGIPDAYARYSAESLVEKQPDVIIADKVLGLDKLLDTEPWRSLHAVANKRVYVLGDTDILERPGPRYVQGLAWLIARLHPDAAHE